MKNTPRIVASSIRPLFGHVTVRVVVPGDKNRPPIGEVLSRAPDIGDEIQVGTMVLCHSGAGFPSFEGEICLLSEREIYGILPEKDAKPLIDWHRDDPGPEAHRETRTSSASTIVAKVDTLVDKIKRNLSYQVCVCIGTSRPHEDLDPPQGQTPTGPWKPFAASTFLLGEETNHRVFWSRPLVPEDTQAQASPPRPAPPSDYGNDEAGPIWTGGEAYVWCTYCTKNHAVQSGETMCGGQRSWIRDPR